MFTFKPCMGIDELLINDQSLWQLEYKSEATQNLLVFKEDYVILTTDLTTMLGSEMNTTFYIYSYNFSMN